MLEDIIWNEKYRPKELSELLGNALLKAKLQEFIDKQDIPNLLLHGTAGTGKTTISQILVNKLDCNYKYLNASDTNSIDNVREEIKTFASTKSLRKFKIVILDECDRISLPAFSALK